MLSEIPHFNLALYDLQMQLRKVYEAAQTVLAPGTAVTWRDTSGVQHYGYVDALIGDWSDARVRIEDKDANVIYEMSIYCVRVAHNERQT